MAQHLYVVHPTNLDSSESYRAEIESIYMKGFTSTLPTTNYGYGYGYKHKKNHNPLGILWEGGYTNHVDYQVIGEKGRAAGN